MLNNLPFRKGYLLVVGTILLLFISYEFALKKTIESWQINRNYKQQLTGSLNIGTQPAYYERKNRNISKIIDFYRADTSDLRDKIITTISSIADAEKVRLAEVPVNTPLFHTDQFIIQKLVFEGDYFHFLQVLNQIEKAKGVGIIRSAVIKSKATISNNENRQATIMELYLEIIKS